MSVYLMLKIAGLLIAVLLLACAWLYECARRAEEDAEHWKNDAGQWQSLANGAGDSAKRAAGFAQDAVDTLASRQEELDRKDAEIARLHDVCKHFVEQEQSKHRLWREAIDAGERAPFVRQMAETIRHARDMHRTLHRN